MNTQTPDTSLDDELLLREAVARSLSGSVPDIDREWSLLRERKSIPVRRRGSAFKWQLLSAACAAVAVVLATVLLFSQRGGAEGELWAAVSAPEGQRCQLTLPDGTRVWLSGGSTLRYPATFSPAERRVRLTGDAFFDVTKDARHPFTVSTQWLTARVLGTQFSIHGSSADDCHVALFTGKVVVTPVSGEAPEVTLRPGEEVRITPRGAARTTQAPRVPHLEAQKGEFEFADTPLRDVVTELASWYHLAVVTPMDDITQRRVHFAFDLGSSPAEAVALLNMLNVAHITLDGDKLTVEETSQH